METILHIAAWLIALAPLPCLLWFIIEMAWGLRPLRTESGQGTTALASSAIIIPAHDEAGGIAETVQALRTVAPAQCRLVVIADNCTDATAARARAAGAEAIERRDDARRGKGYALAFGRDYLAPSPPDIVLIVDADCRLDPGTVEALVAAVNASGRPAQALDVIEPDLALAPLAQISGFAMLVKNVVRQRGLMRAGGCSLLCGTGMAFAWRDFSTAPLATGNAVEDLGLAVTMIRAGTRPQLVEGGRVTSRAASVAETVAQRNRWEHGFLRTALRHALPELAGGIATANRARFALGLHLLVPPLALLLATSAALLAVSTLIGWLSSFWLPTAVLGVAVLLAGLLVIIAWVLEGRQTLAFAALLRAPLYVLWKLPIYLRFLKAPQTAWNRTRRENEG
ncbi:MAG: glycosyltransferase family 2 protein [Proteobacteria bacterium]|nr:glycosyltransferase family 2 protein [Pseudomonadota bacterium]